MVTRAEYAALAAYVDYTTKQTLEQAKADFAELCDNAVDALGKIAAHEQGVVGGDGTAISNMGTEFTALQDTFTAIDSFRSSLGTLTSTACDPHEAFSNS